MNIIFIFIILSIVNVIFSTVRAILTINGGKLVASLINAGYFAFYNIMVLYTVADFPMWQKCVITFACNLIGVYIVKLIEQKMRKDRLWKIEFTVRKDNQAIVIKCLEQFHISYNYIEIGKHTAFNTYCATQQESRFVKDIINAYNGKYFASEGKILF